MVIGSPTNGFMNSLFSVYGCGDICIDLIGCDKCKKTIKGDIVDVLKKKSDNSHVIYESCVLEVLDKQKQQKALKEIKRVSGNNYFQVRINPTIFVNLIKNLPFIKYGVK